MSDRLLGDARYRPRGDLWAVAVGSPGAISADGVVSTSVARACPAGSGSTCASGSAASSTAAVLVEGDVALGAHAELDDRRARSLSDVVYVLCGIRTSGAAIVDGKVHRGVHGAAGIVGEMPELRWAELNELYGSSVLGHARGRRAKQIFELARAGDPAAIAAVDEFADDLATGAAAMTLALDPELRRDRRRQLARADVFLPRFEQTLAGICPLPPDGRRSTLGSEAVAMGGISLAADRLEAVLESAVRERDAFPTPARPSSCCRVRAWRCAARPSPRG